MYLNKNRLIWLLVPILLFRPLWEAFERLNHSFWQAIKGIFSIPQQNPLVSILLLLILILCSTHR